MVNGKIAFVFPGQGAQIVGMGKELSATFPECGRLMDSASAAIGIDLGKLCFEGPEADLSQTQNTQPALFAASAVALAAFRSKCGIKPDFVAGHSLGEFTALYAAEVFSFEDGVKIVRKRGTYMSQAGGGAMAAVLGLDAAVIEDVCRMASRAQGDVAPANYNGEAQTVIAGRKDAVERAIPLLTGRGAKKVVPLNVSAAFHSPFMAEAAQKLSADLDALKFGKLAVPLVNNVDARITTNPAEARDGVKRQVTGAVRWTDVMRVMALNGVQTVVEFGPGRTLCGMFKRMDKSVVLHNVEDAASLAKTVEALNQNA